MPKGLFTKLVVRNNSTLEVRVSPTPAPPPDRWTADLFLRGRDGNLIRHFDNASLRAGITQALVGTGPDYVMGQLVLTFAGPSRAQVDIAVKKPGGQPHGKNYSEVHSSAPADSVLLVLSMA